MSPLGDELIALCLGSNTPDSEEQLATAIGALAGLLAIQRVASPYRTAAVSPIAQPDYFNTALVARASHAPDELLGLTKALEHAAGRRRGPRHGPRPLDIDLAIWGRRQVDHPELTLPHPRLRERAFFLAPLAEIAPELPVPPDGRSVAELLRELDRAGVERQVWTGKAQRSLRSVARSPTIP